MARSKVSCKMVPDVPGKDEASKMYLELNELTKNKPLTNLIYASYLQEGVAAQMDALGYSRNSQGQHRARDIYAFFEVGSMKSALSAEAQSRSLGFTDSSNALVDFEGPEAYTKAQEFNNNNKGRVAYVVQHGRKFNILIDERDSRTQVKVSDVNAANVMWNALSAELTKRGIDINDLYILNPTLVNPGSVKDFVKNLTIYKYTPNDGFSVRDIELLLALNKDMPIVKNILSRGWGTLTETAQKMYDTLHSSASLPSNVTLVENVLNNTKRLDRFDLNGLRTELGNVSKDFRENDASYNIQKTIKKLNEEYHLDSDVFVRKSTDIKKYSEAVADAIMSLQRQIRVIESKSGKTTKSKSLIALRDRLLEELKYKQYTSGLSDFMNTAMSYITQVNATLDSVAATGNNMEYAHNLADATAQAANLRSSYYNVVSAIADTELINDFALTDTEKQELRDLAKSIKDLLDSQDKKVAELQKEAMLQIGKEFIGEHNALYGKDVVDIINMVEADTSMTDYLYSIGRSSNTVISMLGAIVRDAQTQRDTKLTQIALEIRRATHLLSQDGKDSSFMYDDKGRIVSEYDWGEYYKQRAIYAKELLKRGISKKSTEFEEEMLLWEDANTEEVVVDKESGRTEKLPIYKIDEDFREGWSAAQREYYDRMMDLKGRIGTLLPNYAQHQYLAPQKRTSWDQVLKEAINGERSFSNVAHWFLENSKIWKMKEADDRFRKSGIYLGEEESLASLSDYDNTILRQIPIFYVKKIDENNLSHDFSSAIQSLASTALNYEAMEGIRNIAEMMTDYSFRSTPVERDVTGRAKYDSIISEGIGVATSLRKSAKDNGVSSMLDAFVLKHIYGVENRSEGLGAIICANLIGYTSLKGLAVNVKGALTNKYVGVLQTMIEAFGGQYYDFKDLLKAEAVLLGEQGASTFAGLTGATIGGLPGAAIGLAVGTAIGAKGMTGKFIDIITNNKNSKDSLIAEFFDEAQEVFSNLKDQRYHSTVFGRLFGSFNPMAMYSRGEYWIHMLNVYAILFHEKVVQYDSKTGKRKIISLYDALEKGDKIEGNAELKLKEGIFRMDGKKIDGLSSDYFAAIKRRMRHVNQQCHGSMNKEDKGLLHQWMLGKMAMNFRQWMVEHYSRRFRKLHWDESIRDLNFSNFYNNTKVNYEGKKVSLIDALEFVDEGTADGAFHYEIKDGVFTLDGRELTSEILDKMLNDYAEDTGWRKGFKTDSFDLFISYIKEYKDYQTSVNAYWNSLSETQKADAKRVLGEAVLLAALAGLSGLMGDPDDHKGEWAYRLWMYVIKRCYFDEKAATLPGAIIEAKTIINNPIASAQTVAGLLYPILGIGDITETIQSGRYEGWNKYGRNILKYTIPFYSQIDQILNIDEESGVFKTFEGQITR